MVTALASGRRVGVHRLADGDGPTVVLCHPAPGSGVFDPDPAETARRGITLLGVDRAGYGDSEPLPAGEWATVERAADDVAEVVESLVGEPVAVAGWSAGGRVALALAARRPELVSRVAVVATPAPDEAVPWLPEELRAGLDALRGMPVELVHAILDEQMGALAGLDPSSAEALELIGAGPADGEALDLEGARRRLAGMLEAALRQGSTGMVSDIAGYCLRSWGFEPSSVQARTLLLYGVDDVAIGYQHGHWWQKALPNARLEMAPGRGHLVVIPLWRRVLSHLAPRHAV